MVWSWRSLVLIYTWQGEGGWGFGPMLVICCVMWWGCTTGLNFKKEANVLCAPRTPFLPVFTSAAPPVFILQLHSVHTPNSCRWWVLSYFSSLRSQGTTGRSIPSLSAQRLLLDKICTGRNSQYEVWFTTVFISSSVSRRRITTAACAYATCLAFLCLVNMEGAPALNDRLAYPRVIRGSIE